MMNHCMCLDAGGPSEFPGAKMSGSLDDSQTGMQVLAAK